ncbi:MAG: phosphoribosylformylglycinamidine cyclo-ligase [Pseudobdellovibrionaceae bacterium]
MSNHYKSAGVDIENGDQFAEWIGEQQGKYQFWKKHLIPQTEGYGSIFRFQFPEYNKPCLVSSTDGVGTKLKLIQKPEHNITIAQDLVAMCVNDLVCVGAKPLYFLDYYATGKLDQNAARFFLQGLYEALRLCECDLVGGETAEMPSVYHGEDFDCAGFVTGVVNEDQILGKTKVQVGDSIFGLGSSGVHSNGFSLLRRIFEKDVDDWREKLLIPTRLYEPFARLARKKKIQIHGYAHITGGGVTNIPRILPARTFASMKLWQIPDIFLEVQKRSGMSTKELLTVLNCGIGMVVIAPASQKSEIQALAQEMAIEFYELGRVEAKLKEHSGQETVEETVRIDEMSFS